MVFKKQIPNLPKDIIINADDFGISKGTNVAIEKTHRNGILTSTSIMPSGFAFEDAVKIAKRNPRLGIGVHLSITWGKSVLPKKDIPDLVDNDNYFYPGVSRTFFKVILNPTVTLQIKKEFDGQIKKVIKSGIKPDHLNGQEHIHFLPFVYPVVVSLAKKYKIKYVRVPLEPLFAAPSLLSFLKWGFLQSMGIVLKIQKNKFSNIKFYGILFTSQMSREIVEKIILTNKKYPIEILLHPGLPNLGRDKNIFSRQKVDEFLLSPNRISEFKTLINPRLKNYLKKSRVRIARFIELN